MEAALNGAILELSNAWANGILRPFSASSARNGGTSGSIAGRGTERKESTEQV